MKLKEILEEIPGVKQTENVEKCPVCGHEFNKIRGIHMFSGYDNQFAEGVLTVTSLKSVSFHQKHLKLPARVRNLGVVMRMACENNHLWSKAILFDKGITYSIPVVESREGEDADTPIHRDVAEHS
jgi:hypothetical protein